MKTKDLIVGTEVFVSTRPKWEYGYTGGTRYTVEDNTQTWYYDPPYRRWNDDSPIKTVERKLPDGRTVYLPEGFGTVARRYAGKKGVLVSYMGATSHSDKTPKLYYTVVPPQHIRGLYDDCVALIAKNHTDREEARKKANEAYAKKEAARTEFTARLAAYGIRIGRDYSSYGFATVDQKDIAQILALLDAVSVPCAQCGRPVFEHGGAHMHSFAIPCDDERA